MNRTHHRVIVLGAAVASLLLLVNQEIRAERADARIPIEVEVQAGAASCAPGFDGFDEGFRSALEQPSLKVIHAGSQHRVIGNPFVLASKRPDVKPRHVRVRIRCDAGSIIDGGPPTWRGYRTADHWLVHVAAGPYPLILLPTLWRRTSLWAPSNGEACCTMAGRMVAYCVLEALCRQTRSIEPRDQLVLGVGVSRDRRYSEADEGASRSLVHGVPDWGPAAAVGVILFITLRTLVRTPSKRHNRTDRTRP